MSATNYIEAKILDTIFRAGEADYTTTDLYIGLATAVADEEAGSVTEVANAGSYARVQVCNKSGVTNSFAAASGGSISTDTQIDFATATANWGTVTHIIITDSGTYGGGNILFVGALTTSKAVGNGDKFIITSGNLTITLD